MDQTHTSPDIQPQPAAVSRGWILSGLVLGLAAMTCVVLAWSVGRDQPALDQDVQTVPPAPDNANVELPPVLVPPTTEIQPAAAAVDSNKPGPAELVGRWRFNDGIDRRIDMHADGTALMHVILDPLSTFLYGPELKLNVVWELQDQHLKYTLTGGTPAEKVDLLLAHFGDVQNYQIVEYTDEAILLELLDLPTTSRKQLTDGKQSRWIRESPCDQP